MTAFQEAVLEVVRLVPFGKVVSYGQVAAYIGAPRAARQVGWAMRSLEFAPGFPWWRVINNAGLITIKGNESNTPEIQKEHLKAEGIIIIENEGYRLDIEHYRFRPSTEIMTSLKMDPIYISSLQRKYGI